MQRRFLLQQQTAPSPTVGKASFRTCSPALMRSFSKRKADDKMPSQVTLRFQRLPDSMKPVKLDDTYTPFPLPKHDKEFGFGPTNIEGIPDVERQKATAAQTPDNIFFDSPPTSTEAIRSMNEMLGDASRSPTFKEAQQHGLVDAPLDGLRNDAIREQEDITLNRMEEPLAFPEKEVERSVSGFAVAHNPKERYVPDPQSDVIGAVTCRRSLDDLLLQLLRINSEVKLRSIDDVTALNKDFIATEGKEEYVRTKRYTHTEAETEKDRVHEMLAALGDLTDNISSVPSADLKRMMEGMSLLTQPGEPPLMVAFEFGSQNIPVQDRQYGQRFLAFFQELESNIVGPRLRDFVEDPDLAVRVCNLFAHYQVRNFVDWWSPNVHETTGKLWALSLRKLIKEEHHGGHHLSEVVGEMMTDPTVTCRYTFRQLVDLWAAIESLWRGPINGITPHFVQKPLVDAVMKRLNDFDRAVADKNTEALATQFKDIDCEALGAFHFTSAFAQHTSPQMTALIWRHVKKATPALLSGAAKHRPFEEERFIAAYEALTLAERTTPSMLVAAIECLFAMKDRTTAIAFAQKHKISEHCLSQVLFFDKWIAEKANLPVAEADAEEVEEDYGDEDDDGDIDVIMKRVFKERARVEIFPTAPEDRLDVALRGGGKDYVSLLTGGINTHIIAKERADIYHHSAENHRLTHAIQQIRGNKWGLIISFSQVIELQRKIVRALESSDKKALRDALFAKAALHMIQKEIATNRAVFVPLEEEIEIRAGHGYADCDTIHLDVLRYVMNKAPVTKTYFLTDDTHRGHLAHNFVSTRVYSSEDYHQADSARIIHRRDCPWRNLPTFQYRTDLKRSMNNYHHFLDMNDTFFRNRDTNRWDQRWDSRYDTYQVINKRWNPKTRTQHHDQHSNSGIEFGGSAMSRGAKLHDWRYLGVHTPDHGQA